jgi:hypothetical protein
MMWGLEGVGMLWEQYSKQWKKKGLPAQENDGGGMSGKKPIGGATLVL